MIYVAQIAAFFAAASWLIYMQFTDNGYIVAGFGFGAAYLLTVTFPELLKRLRSRLHWEKPRPLGD